jgi:predicted HTH transcriptional regulator
MDIITIENVVRPLIAQVMNDQEAERSKIDFKRSWYDLTNKKDINEFAKDTSAIANSFGPDGFIIIGVDVVAKTFFPAKFHHSRMKDTALIIDLLAKKFSEPFEIGIYDMTVDGNELSIIQIPP